ncbi:MAG: GNAT family N-acetyltransferase [Chloroflexi bacterium]|jgi:ribosomal protein S18 acetylase RimI-like enzyme|nr:GNAT family N-acetyltransferase [Chloroflexota bacterium]
MAVKIRSILPTDRAHIIRVTDETRAFLPDELVIVGEIIDEYFNDPEGSGYHFLIAEHGGDFAGYLCYGPTPLTHGAWDMYWCAVSPKLHGQGIAGTLFSMAADDIKKQGGRLILIDTSSNPNYKAARSLYITLGYKHVSTIPDFYNPGDNKETFWKVP